MSDNPVHAHYLGHGGAAGVLGSPIGEEEQLSDGCRQHYRGVLRGAQHPISVRIPAEGPYASCDQPNESGTPVESTIAWSTRTGAHVVHGEIRHLWLELGGESGQLGYPVSDEMPTSDGRGRRSQFEHGEIQWFTDTGAQLVVGVRKDVAKTVVSGAQKVTPTKTPAEKGVAKKATKAPAKKDTQRGGDEDPTKKATAKKTPTKTSASKSVSKAVVKKGGAVKRAGLSRRGPGGRSKDP